MKPTVRVGLASSLLLLSQVALAEQITLKVAAFPAVDQIIKLSLKEWQKSHPNVKVDVVSRQFSDHHTAMTTALATSSGLPDIMAVEYGFLGRFAFGGGFADLNKPPFNVGQHKNKWVQYAYEQGASKKHGQSAIPTDIGPGALFYRKDLLEKAGVDPILLSKSWETYVEAGTVIKQKTGAYLLAHARDIKDIIIRSNVPVGEGVYFKSKGKPVIATSERFKRAFKMAKRVRELGLDAKISAWSNEWSESFKRGKVASQMMGAWLAGHLSNWLAPKTAGLWRSSPLPASAQASWGGTFYAIPKRAKHKELAWDLLQHLTLNTKQQLLAFQEYDAFPVLLAAQEGDFFEKPIDFLGGQKARLQWRDSARLIEASAVFKHDPIAEEIVNNELDLVLTRGKDINKALKDANNMVKRRSRR